MALLRPNRSQGWPSRCCWWMLYNCGVVCSVWTVNKGTFTAVINPHNYEVAMQAWRLTTSIELLRLIPWVKHLILKNSDVLISDKIFAIWVMLIEKISKNSLFCYIKSVQYLTSKNFNLQIKHYNKSWILFFICCYSKPLKNWYYWIFFLISCWHYFWSQAIWSYLTSMTAPEYNSLITLQLTCKVMPSISSKNTTKKPLRRDE